MCIQTVFFVFWCVCVCRHGCKVFLMCVWSGCEVFLLCVCRQECEVFLLCVCVCADKSVRCFGGGGGADKGVRCFWCVHADMGVMYLCHVCADKDVMYYAVYMQTKV